MISITFKNEKTGELVFIDGDDFESFCKYMKNRNWTLTFVPEDQFEFLMKEEDE